MDEQQLRQWLDSNSKTLLAQIENAIPVKFTLWDNDSYGCQVHKNEKGENSDVEVFYKEPISQAKIAHELLHAKVDIILGDGITLFDVPHKCKPLEGLLSNADQIVNACEHYIFFPDFLDMGYTEEESFEEYQLSDETRQLLDSLCQHGLKNGLFYDFNKVFQYLSLAFTCCLYPNDERFVKEKERLKKLDKVLYSKVDKLRDDCDLKIIPENKQYLQDAYRGFSRSMNSWFLANRPK